MSALFSDEVRRNPYPLYRRLRAASPVLHDPQTDVWMVFDYEGVHRVLDEPHVFSSRAAPGGGKPLDWLVFNDPPRHTKLRALIMRAFTPRVVSGLERRIGELSRELLDRAIVASAKGELDLAAEYSVPLPLMVIAEMLGIPLADRPKFKRWSDVILNLAESISGGETAVRATQEFGAVKSEMHQYMVELIAQRHPADSGRRADLLSGLVEAQLDGERLTEQEMLGFFQLLVLAGAETTTNLINNAIVCFVEHPDQLALLRERPELLPSAIEEVLRYRSPIQAAFRQAMRDVELHGQTIPGGKLVLPMIGSANRDPRQFADAERFNTAREPNAHLAFGHGIHFCLGAALSRLEARIALADLLSRFGRFELASNEPWPPRHAFHVHGPSLLSIRYELAARIGVGQ